MSYDVLKIRGWIKKCNFYFLKRDRTVNQLATWNKFRKIKNIQAEINQQVYNEGMDSNNVNQTQSQTDQNMTFTNITFSI